MYYLNGEILKKDPYTEADFYGKALFETIYGRGKILFFLEKHLERIEASAEKIKIGTGKDLKRKIEDFLDLAGYGRDENIMFKLQVSKNNIYMKVLPFEPRFFPEGIKAGFIEGYYQNELGMYKSANYLGNILAREEMVEAGCFEGIFRNRLGQVTEGTISNLFFVKEGTLYTPELVLNILPGITRETIIQIAREEGVMVQEGVFEKEKLMEADSIFFTNSLMKKGLVWVTECEGKEFKKDELIHKLEKRYLKLLESML